MKIFGRELSLKRKAQQLSPVGSRGWYPFIREAFPGSWQRNIEICVDDVLSASPVFACVTLIAGDMGKLRQRLVERDENGVWSEVQSPAFSPVLKRPNRFQHQNQFKACWSISRLTRGNTYALKQRDNRGIVIGLYLLDPMRVRPMVTPDGDVLYECSTDNLAGLEQSITVPASEVIHDRWNCMHHPLVGLSPIFACGLAATQGLRIQRNSAMFFGNASRPSGVLTAPGTISTETAERLREQWEKNYGGENIGRVAVLGDALKFEPMAATAEASQMVEQLKISAESVCSAFHVPPFKIGIGAIPAQSADVLNGIYYSDCLQTHIEDYEACMDEGLGLDTPKDGRQLGVDLDLDGLSRMDMPTRVRTAAEAVKGSVVSINEARARWLDMKPVPGGESILSQQQYYSIEALAERDSNDPFAKAPMAVAGPQAVAADPEDSADQARAFTQALVKGLGDLKISDYGLEPA